MKASWSDNFHSQINETRATVMNLTKDCDMIQKLSDNIVLRGEMIEVNRKLEKTADIELVESLRK